jgi:hypothetical protein
MALRRPSLLVVLALVLALALPGSAAAEPAPVAAGTSAGNIALNSASKAVVMRWVARATGDLKMLHVRIAADGSACRLNGRTGYGLGNGGSWRVSTHPVLPDGRPDTARTLTAHEFRPCAAGLETVDVNQAIAKLRMGIAVTRGTEYATVVRNGDSSPTQNFTSLNFLYTSTGLVGANARNERSPLAPDAHYGLDARELVGFTRDGGANWALPGGPYGLPGGRNFLPTYIQEFSDGRVAGQPYYYTAAASTADRTMVFGNIKRDWTIRELGAFTATAGEGTLTLTVDGVERARVAVSGGGMLRAAIPATRVVAGQTVRVTSSGLSIQNIVADTAWGLIAGLNLSTRPWRVEGQTNWSHAAPVYALPAPDADGILRRWVHSDAKAKKSKKKPGKRKPRKRPGTKRR